MKQRFYWLTVNHWLATIANFCKACTYLPFQVKSHLTLQKWRKRKFIDVDWFWNCLMVRTGLSNALYKTNEVESFTKQVSYFARSDWLKSCGWFVTGYSCFHSSVRKLAPARYLWRFLRVFLTSRVSLQRLICSILSVGSGEQNCGEREKKTSKDCGSQEASTHPSALSFFLVLAWNRLITPTEMCFPA